MKRGLWTAKISDTHAPEWPCPSCHGGHLLLEPKSLRYEETPESVTSRVENDDWDPEWTDFTFAAWLRCSNQACKAHVAVMGTGGLDPTIDPDQGMTWENYFTPMFARPMPDIFSLPPKCPDEVCEALRRSFAAFWSDSAASANSARVALEHLLGAMGVPEKRRNKAGKYSRLTLHDRIKELQKANPTIGDQLMAVKWLGNTGSHEGRISQSDILDAYEILEHALDELINRRSKRVAQLAKGLSKKHAPKR